MKIVTKKKQELNLLEFSGIRISLASPEQIREWSYGEVKKTETLNYRTLKPELDGLFCEKIFGPVRDYECSCGKYKKPVTVDTQATQYKKMICDRCRVEITTSKVRRERMGHIELAVPVAHFWYFGKTPSKIAIFLDMLQDDVKNIVYGLAWVVVKEVDVKDAIIKVFESEAASLKKLVGTENYDKLTDVLTNEKVKFLLPKKTVLDIRNTRNLENFAEYLEKTFDECVKNIKFDKKDVEKVSEKFSEILKNNDYDLVIKIISSITDDRKYIGNLADPKNYLKEKVSVLTNAEALYRLLKIDDKEMDEELEKIRQQLQDLAVQENKIRVNNLFEKYKDVATVKEDIDKLIVILDNLKKLSKNVKDINFEELLKENRNDKLFIAIARMKAELIKNIDKLPDEIQNVLYELFEKYNIKIQPSANRSRLINRFKLIESFRSNNVRPEWMILQVLPVLPPDLRPLVPIEGGRFASSDLNEFYRRIIHRNNRLRKFLGGISSEKGREEEAKGIPKLILLNEKRLLQEAVDALIENSAKRQPLLNNQGRPLKSLTDILKGKQGRFRQNLLGKRIDYSGRSTIVVNPELKLYQCGLPKEMAFELFKPFILHKLCKKYGVTIKKAKNMMLNKTSEIWDIIDEITRHHPVLLNRAPTLHRPSIQAFEPVLVEGKAIQIHPMVCPPFNADFDGDQMAVYVPITLEALAEAKLLMMSYMNLFSPAHGKVLIGPTQDVVLGVAYLTAVKDGEKGEGRIFSTIDEAIHNYQQALIALNAKIKVVGLNDLEIKKDKNGKIIDTSVLENPQEWSDYTTVGQLIFATILPPEVLPFYYSILSKKRKLRKEQQEEIFIGKKELGDIIRECYIKAGLYQTVVFLDELKKLGYHYVTISGMTISVDDMIIPDEKYKLIEETWEKIKEVEKQVKEGAITEKERYDATLDIWSKTVEDITNKMIEKVRKLNMEKYTEGKERFNSVYLMAMSGARGNIDQVRQLSAIRGLMSRPQKKISGEIGEIIETPVISSFREGLKVLEFFISTHGGRKGLSDTALKTSEAGYLTRRLIDVAHHVVVTEEDCHTLRAITVSALKVGDEVLIPLWERITGRVAFENIAYEVYDKEKGEIVTKVVKAGEIITEEQAKEIEQAGIERIKIRSVLTCESEHGVCAKCYGMDMSTGRLVTVGEAVGIIAAQSIGEPGTQLTLRTFHIGGAAARLTKQSQVIAEGNGRVEWRVEPHGEHGQETLKFKTIKKKEESGRTVHIVVSSDAIIRCIYTNEKGEVIDKKDKKLEYGSRIYFEDGAEIKKGDLIADWDKYSIPIISEKSGKVKYTDLELNKTYVVEYHASGLPEIRVLPYKGRKKPRLDIISDNRIVATYPLPVDTVILVNDGEEVEEGDVIAKIPKEEIKTKDITGGLPRIEELFEARHPHNSAVLSEIEGIVKFETKQEPETSRGQSEIKIAIKVENKKNKKEKIYEIPPGRTPLVYEHDKVEPGEPLTDGVIDPHKYLEIRGPLHLQEFLLNEIQEVYRVQGVNIHDKHIEIIIRQMLSFVRITDPGVPPESDKNKKFYKFIYGELVPKKLFESEVRKIEQEKKELRRQGKTEKADSIVLPKAEPVLLGITTVASLSESFLSAASFQETSRVLTDAAVESKVDYLLGLKENVIIGHLVPCGTGFYAEEASMLKKEEKLSELIKI